jgi:hypothetical protein
MQLFFGKATETLIKILVQWGALAQANMELNLSQGPHDQTFVPVYSKSVKLDNCAWRRQLKQVRCACRCNFAHGPS